MTASGLTRLAVILHWTLLLVLMLTPMHFQAMFQGFGTTIFVNAILLASVLFWLEADADRRGVSVTRRWRYLIVLTGPLGIAAFVLQSRGFRGFLGFVAKFVLCLVAFVVVLVAAEAMIQQLQ